MYGNFYQPQFQNAPYSPNYAPIPAPARSTIAGKIVNDYGDITIQDIPTDCSPAFFVKGDLSEIQVRRWSDTGSVISECYRKVDAVVKPDPMQELKTSIDDISRRIDELQDSIKANTAVKATRRKEATNEEN